MRDILLPFRLLKRKAIHWKYNFVCKHCSVETASKVRYKMLMHKRLNLDNPVTLNEKLQWLKLNTYRDNELVTQCCDKYRVREYVESTGNGRYLVELYGVYDDVEKINFDKLPDSFVLKCNHGSGSVICCEDKSKLDIEKTKEKLKQWMNEDYAKTHAELSYVGITPKVICERFIKSEDGKPPKDYKIFCSYGIPKFLYVASDRYDGNTKFDYYDLKWEWINVRNDHPNAGPILPKPSNLNEMLDLAAKLSKPFPLVRVDLYNEYNEIIFGELTFCHCSGVAAFQPDTYDKYFGGFFPDVKDCIIQEY